MDTKRVRFSMRTHQPPWTNREYPWLIQATCLAFSRNTQVAALVQPRFLSIRPEPSVTAFPPGLTFRPDRLHGIGQAEAFKGPR